MQKITQELCYWKFLVTQAELFVKRCKICQQFKKIKSLYGNMPSKNIAEIKAWNLVHVDLIGPYSKSIIQQQPDGTVIFNNPNLTCMKIIDPATGWFEIIEIRTFCLKEVVLGINEYIDKSSSRVVQMFNNTFLFKYPRPHKVVFDNRSEFKVNFTPLLKYFGIKPVLTSVKNPQSSAPLEWVHQAAIH